MHALEQNIPALLTFLTVWVVCCSSFFVISGYLPLSSRPAALAGSAGALFTLMNVGFLLFLCIQALAFGLGELRWSTVVIVSGLVFLFTPPVTKIWPKKRLSSHLALAALLAAQLMAWLLLTPSPIFLVNGSEFINAKPN
ncbi:hypothetical protein SAMN05216338_106629 [Bradyrhizobium sp. Rc2d]|uniref:hypothetical protein n=1 Tax=Bradyrhizobium sp. Rc2d TaxID=1855321 RepID=UPI00088F63E7|nr:hypothetical protein [Bradyrhizobium sp. Rc2d]SDJ80055.1 hypothetical protein SAMN05216338_106629 [Bradyrhizobium sp. Rc2d]